MSSVSSKGSSNYTRYPSGMTSLTAFSSETPSLCMSPSSSTPVTYQHHQQQQYSDDGQLISDDQFDIINSLNYDDVDDGLIGKLAINLLFIHVFFFSLSSL